LVEHVARAYEESANSVAGAPTKFPKIPGLLRLEGPSTPAAARARLEEAVRKFEQACRTRIATADTYENSIFGRGAVSDYIRFQEMHTRHHRKQLPES
jgi:hypothetical protein